MFTDRFTKCIHLKVNKKCAHNSFDYVFFYQCNSALLQIFYVDRESYFTHLATVSCALQCYANVFSPQLSTLFNPPLHPHLTNMYLIPPTPPSCHSSTLSLLSKNCVFIVVYSLRWRAFASAGMGGNIKCVNNRIEEEIRVQNELTKTHLFDLFMPLLY